MPMRTCGDERASTGVRPLPFSPAARGGDRVRVRVPGRVAIGEDGEPVPGGVAARTRRATETLVAALRTAGCTLDDEVIDVRLDDPRGSRTFSGVYASDGLAPARSTMRSEPMIDAGTEIDRIAHEPV